jgi:hypothetical protein
MVIGLFKVFAHKVVFRELTEFCIERLLLFDCSSLSRSSPNCDV